MTHRRIIMANNILVVYFSCSGITANAAKTLAKVTGGELKEIIPAVPYTKDDLNWMDKNSRSTIECRDQACRPEIAEKIDINGYDVIYVGFPIWWYREPNIIDTFLESNNFSGKIIVPFATSGSSGLGKSAANIRKLCPGSTVKEGFMLNHNPSTEDVKNILIKFDL